MSVLEDGQLVFYNHPAESWIIGTVDGAPDAKGVYKVKDRDKGLGVSVMKRDDLYPILNVEIMTEDCADLLLLSELHQSTLLNTLRRRYLDNVVYTYIGPIVIALNPFNYTIPWYKDDFMPNYLAEGHVIQKNKPHSWSVAHNTYYEMVDDRQDQCVLVSGESGAGKTEAVKIVIKYLRGLMQKLAKDSSHREQLEAISHKVLQASPILESFGNAKTGRNDNSSRFGKFLKVQFDKDGFIAGSAAIQYLLEKSRVLTAAEGERVYHAFYQVAKGKDASKYGLGAPKDYPSLMAGKVLDNASMEDAEGDDLSYRMSNEAYAACGISPAQADAVWRCCAGILHLYRVVFKEKGEGSEIDPASKGFVEAAAKMWQVSPEKLGTELCQTAIEVRGEVNLVLHNVPRATTTRNSLCMSLYKGLFDFLVDVINAGTSAAAPQHFIGLLDIFGFEDFAVNSFEQCCINLANETLQNHYNDYIFNKDMEECRAEGIEVESIQFADNTPTCQLLIQKGTGIFRLLDDESAMGSGNDNGFLEKISAAHGGKHASFERKPIDRDSFSIKHYAGTVKYTVTDFVVKNKDVLKDAFKTLFREEPQCEVMRIVLPAPVEKSGRAPTVSNFFVTQISDLMDLINSTNPHWIRCIKPHPAKKPLMFHGVSSMNQMISSGIIETVRLRMLGFPVRIKYQAFVGRFAVLARGEGKGDPTATCTAILKACGYSKELAQLGKTKVFLKSHIYQDIEEKKKAALRSFAVTVQQYARCVGATIFSGRKRKGIALRHLQAELRDWLRASAAARAERQRQREELMARLKDAFVTFDADEAAGRSAVVAEWQAMIADLAVEKAAHYKGVIGNELAHVVRLEGSKRAAVEDDRAAELKLIFRDAATVWREILEREEARLESIRNEFASRFADLVRQEEVERRKLERDEGGAWEEVLAAVQPLLDEVFRRVERVMDRYRRRERKLGRLMRLREEEHARVERMREEELHGHRAAVDRWATAQEAARQRELDRIADVNEVTRRMSDLYRGAADPVATDRLSHYRDSWRQRYEMEHGVASPPTSRSVGPASPGSYGTPHSRQPSHYPQSPLAAPPDPSAIPLPRNLRLAAARDAASSGVGFRAAHDPATSAAPYGAQSPIRSPHAAGAAGYRPAVDPARYRMFPSARAPPADDPSRYPSAADPPIDDAHMSPPSHRTIGSHARTSGSPYGPRSPHSPASGSVGMASFTLYTGGGARRVYEVTARTTFESVAPGAIITNERGAVYPPGDTSGTRAWRTRVARRAVPPSHSLGVPFLLTSSRRPAVSFLWPDRSWHSFAHRALLREPLSHLSSWFRTAVLRPGASRRATS